MSDQSSRIRQYEQALRWYPAAWRRLHGPALVNDLMEQDDARGRQRLTPGDRVSLAVQGLRVRALRRQAPTSAVLTLRLVGLVGAVAVAVWYWTVSPSDVSGVVPAGTSLLVSHEPKTFLNNGTFMPVVLLALGFVASVARRDVLARVLAAAAALAALVVTQLAAGTLNGPDGLIGAILITFGVMSAVRVRRWGSVVGFIAVITGAVFLELWFSGAPTIVAVAAAACLLYAVATGLLVLRRMLQERNRSEGTRAGSAA